MNSVPVSVPDKKGAMRCVDCNARLAWIVVDDDPPASSPIPMLPGVPMDALAPAFVQVYDSKSYFLVLVPGMVQLKGRDEATNLLRFGPAKRPWEGRGTGHSNPRAYAIPLVTTGWLALQVIVYCIAQGCDKKQLIEPLRQPGFLPSAPPKFLPDDSVPRRRTPLDSAWRKRLN